MIYALDTNIISFLLRPNKNPEVVAEFERIIELCSSVQYIIYVINV